MSLSEQLRLPERLHNIVELIKYGQTFKRGGHIVLESIIFSPRFKEGPKGV